MRFKFSFDVARWPEYFAWLELPQDLVQGNRQLNESQKQTDRATQPKPKSALKSQNTNQSKMTQEEKDNMQAEIDHMTNF
jgi:hypothetical protein